MTVKLDENQQKAVEHFKRPALVVAGPGSGKTRVIIERILNLVDKRKVDPANILAIAFTNAAAEEMKNRLEKSNLNGDAPTICTLHAFGKDLITNHYKQMDFTQEPEVWGAEDIQQTIYKMQRRLQRENEDRSVSIYKFEGNRTGRCYIGQTIDLKQREDEHRTDSSNRGLREALAKNDEYFNCREIKKVKSLYADEEEDDQINFYKDRSVVYLDLGIEDIEVEDLEIPVTIYKIKLPSVVTCWIGVSIDTDTECIKNEAFRRAIEDESMKEYPGRYPEGIKEALHKVIENDTIKSNAFEIIATVPGTEVIHCVNRKIEEHKKWAVFNRQSPLRLRESNKCRIEMFCKHFDLRYDEVIRDTPKFEDLMKKFNGLEKDIENEKRQVTIGLFDPNKIADPILRAFATRYENVKKEAGVIDFLDMLILSANMLEKNSDILREYQSKYRYVFVDEFQDISPIDFRLIDLLSENLFAVGDDDQAIYGFRGGDSSIMQEKFGKRGNVTHYKITRNYRSTSTIVRHAKALIEHNPRRICKNLRAKNPVQSQVKVFNTPQKTAKVGKVLLTELSNLLTTGVNKVGVLARNWKGEINDIDEILDFSKLREQGFEIRREKLGDRYEENKTKRVLRHGTKEIEILNIHSAKGREWEKVILLVNTIYDNLPSKGNDVAEERRLFYVAVTRAKQELVILDGGECQFVSEFQNVSSIEDIKRGIAYIEVGEYEKAITVLLESPDIDQDDKDVWSNLGRAYYWLDDYANAVSCYQKAANLDPKDKAIHNNLGNSYYWIGEYEKAVDSFQKASELDPNCEKTYKYWKRANFKLQKNKKMQSGRMIRILGDKDIDEFYIDIYLVTNAQYKKFVDANPEWQKDFFYSKYNDDTYLKRWNGGNYPLGESNKAVTYVNWYAAMAYALWVGKRLPTEAEWKKASGDDRLCDMKYNVWQWCLDGYDSNQRLNPVAGIDNIAEIVNNFTNVKTERILRASSWGPHPFLRYTPKGSFSQIGCRCVKAVTT